MKSAPMLAPCTVGIRRILFSLVLMWVLVGCESTPKVGNNQLGLPPEFARHWPDLNGLYFGKGQGFTEGEAIQAALIAVASRIRVEISSDLRSEITAQKRDGDERVHEHFTHASRQQVQPIEIKFYEIVFLERMGNQTFVIVSVDIGAMRASAKRSATELLERGNLLLRELSSAIDCEILAFNRNNRIFLNEVHGFIQELRTLGEYQAATSLINLAASLTRAETQGKANVGFNVVGNMTPAVHQHLVTAFRSAGYGLTADATRCLTIKLNSNHSVQQRDGNWHNRLQMSILVEQTSGTIWLQEERAFNGFSRLNQQSAKAQAENLMLRYIQESLIDRITGNQH